MNQLLKSKTLYKTGLSVELYQAGPKQWGVKIYKLGTGDTVSNFRSNDKASAESYFDAKGDK